MIKNNIKHLPLAAMLLLFSCKKDVTGTNIIDAQQAAVPSNPIDNNDVLGNGINLQPSYYNSGNPTIGWSLMAAQTKIKTVRIEIEPNRVGEARQWISGAKSNGLTVIATYHKSAVLGSNDAAELMAAANWWKANYVTLGGNFTINLMNEWGNHDLTAAAYAAAYNEAIAIVRTVYAGPIVLDISGWGQETKVAADASKIITDKKIILSAHIYPNGYNKGNGHNFQPSDLDDFSAAGRPGMVGEFGNEPSSGTVDWAACVAYAKTKKYPVLGWAWNGDGGGMNMASPSWASAGGGSATSFTLSPYFNIIYDKL